MNGPVAPTHGRGGGETSPATPGSTARPRGKRGRGSTIRAEWKLTQEQEGPKQHARKWVHHPSNLLPQLLLSIEDDIDFYPKAVTRAIVLYQTRNESSSSLGSCRRNCFQQGLHKILTPLLKILALTSDNLFHNFQRRCVYQVFPKILFHTFF